ncbi:hypothetical protein [Amycolatopsis sp. NPDC003731]
MTEFVYRVVDNDGRAVAVGRDNPVAYTDRGTARRHATRLGKRDARWGDTRRAPYRTQRAAVEWEEYE